MNDRPKDPQSDWPTFYIYQDQDGWHRTDDRLTLDINRCVFLRQPFNTAGRAFYPQWPEPTDKTKTRVAWYLRSTSERAARWAWVDRDHHKWHSSCELTTPGRCRSKILLRLSYDPAKKFWTQVANINENKENQCKPTKSSS